MGIIKKKSGFPAIVCRGAREKKWRERERETTEGYIAPLRLSFIPAPLFRGNVERGRESKRHV